MATSRSIGLSTRVCAELHVALCERAKAEGVTLSTLAARILEEKIPKLAGTELRPASSPIPAHQFQGILDRLGNLEAWAQFTFAIAVKGPNWSIDTLPCPKCGEVGLEYMEFMVGANPGSAFICMASPCGWNVRLEAPDALGAGSAPGQPTGQGG